MLPRTRAPPGSNPISAIAVIDLPQPLSPIRPSVSPRARRKSMPRNASAGPRGVFNVTRSPETSSRGAADWDTFALCTTPVGDPCAIIDWIVNVNSDLRSVFSALKQASPVGVDVPVFVRFHLLRRYDEVSLRTS